MLEDICRQAEQAAEELIEKAKLHPGQIVVIGCSTSEICGSRIGSDSRPEVAEQVFAVLHRVLMAHGLYLAAQCCEHLNRAIIIEREAVPGADIVNVVPQPKAGGSFATAAYHAFRDPVAVESIRADAGLDIGRNAHRHAPEAGRRARPPAARSHRRAILLAARVRPKFIAVSAPSTIRTCCKKEKNQGLFRELWNRPVFMPPGGGHGYDNRYARPFRFQWQRNTRRPSLRPRPSGCFRGGRSGP